MPLPEFKVFPKLLHTPFPSWDATVRRIVDGDTIECLIRGPFEIYPYVIVRLVGIDAEALNDDDPAVAAKARDAADYLAGLLPAGTPCRLTVHSYDRYKRWLSTVGVAGGDGSIVVINDQMVATGHAKPWA